MLVMSYFSYKGGSGRSSLVYNTLPFLAKELNATEEHPIVLVDLDIDSAGLSFLLCKEKIKQEGNNVPLMTTNKILSSKNPISKYINSNRNREKTFNQLECYNMFVPVGIELGLDRIECCRSVMFVPVKPGETISNFDSPNNDSISKFIAVCEEYGARAVIFDTPAGDQLAGRNAIDESEILVVCLRITKQHREGTRDFLERKLKNIEGSKLIIVPNAVPNPEERIRINGQDFNFDAVREDIIESLGEVVSKTDNKYIPDMLLGNYFGIPEVKRFKIVEGILYEMKEKLKSGENLSDDEEKAYQAYKHLAEIIIKYKED